MRSRFPGPVESDHQRITVGVDGSDQARWALKWAADEAKRRGLPLGIVHVRVPEERHVPGWYDADATSISPAEAIVDDAEALVATRHPSVLARAEVVEGPPPKALTEASRAADLLVVGARGRGGFRELLLGSVSDQCVQHAHCPIVVVHGDPDDPSHRSSETRVVVGIDGSLGSTRALRWALEEARLRRAPVVGIYAWQYPPIGAFVLGPKRGFEATAQEIIDAASEHAAREAPDVPFEAEARIGDAVPAIFGACRAGDLLVVGAHGHGGFRGAHVGSVAHQLARHAPCEVVVARLDAGASATVSSGGVGNRAGSEVRPAR